VISSQVQRETMQRLLAEAGVSVEKIERGEASLEDVFLSLAR